MIKKGIVVLIFTALQLNLYAQNYQDSLTITLNKLADKNSIVGFAVAIVTPDSVIYSKGFGFADQEKHIPYTINTIQPVASVSKTLIGVSLMKAQEMGKLNLDDDINKYLTFKITNPYCPNEKITIRHLATHTSGLKDTRHYEKSYIFQDKIPPIYKKLPWGIRRIMFKQYVKRYNGNEKIPLNDFLSNIYQPEGIWYKKSNFHKTAPGKRYAYSNNGATLTALIIERATGLKYSDFVNKTISEPLQMNSSGWTSDELSDKEKSALYVMGCKIPHYELITYPDGGFTSCVSEFSNYLMAMIQGYEGRNNILNASSYHELMTPQINPKFKSGIFWEAGLKNVGHSGEDPGVLTFVYFNKENLTGYILFANTSNTRNISKEISQIAGTLNRYAPDLKSKDSE